MKAFLLLAALYAAGRSPQSAPGQTATAPPVTKAYATAELAPGKAEVSVHLTNLSNSAIEAWQIRVTHQLTGGVEQETKLTVDTYLTPPNRPGYGPIPPLSGRDQHVALSGVPLRARVELTMVLFDDLSSEGEPLAVTQVLQGRDEDAQTLRIWTDALQSAAAQRPPQAKVALTKVLEAERQRTKPTNATALAFQENIARLLQLSESDIFSGLVRTMLDEMRRQRVLAERHHPRQGHGR